MLTELVHCQEMLDLFLDSKAGAKSTATVRWYKSKLGPLVDYFEEQEVMVQDVTIYHLRAFRKILAQGTRKQETLRGYVRAIRTFFSWLAAETLITGNPASRLEMPQKAKAPKIGLSERDRDKIIAVAAGSPRDLALVRFLASTLCRAGGIANLTLSDLELERRRAVVHEKGRGGQNKGRWVYFDEETAQALRAYLVVRPDIPDCQAVFVCLKRGGRCAGWHGLTAGGVYQVVKRLAAQAGVKERWNPHNWRHGGVRGATRRGMPLKAISQIIGHSSESVTADIYGDLDDDALQALHDQYTWMGPNKRVDS
jgi:site-specific recombinase XerD